MHYTVLSWVQKQLTKNKTKPKTNGERQTVEVTEKEI